MSKKKILVVIVNYGTENIKYLKIMVETFKKFKKYEVDIIVNSNIKLDIKNIKINIIKLQNYQLLPLTTRTIIWKNRNKYDLYIYSENDHLFLEKHIDNFLRYTKILPNNRIAGLIQYEKFNHKIYYPGFHSRYKWDFNSVEVYNNLKFAHFTNLHQASFIITNKQLLRASKKLINFLYVNGNIKNFKKIKKYSVKCKVNTDLYKYCNMKKLICISEFKDNLIHHMPNKYIRLKKWIKKYKHNETKMLKYLYYLLR